MELEIEVLLQLVSSLGGCSAVLETLIHLWCNIIPLIWLKKCALCVTFPYVVEDWFKLSVVPLFGGGGVISILVRSLGMNVVYLFFVCVLGLG